MQISLFSASGCAGCVTVAKVLSDKGIQFTKKDIMDSDVMEECQQLGIRNIPVTAFYKDGNVVETIVGSSEQAIQRILEIAG